MCKRVLLNSYLFLLLHAFLSFSASADFFDDELLRERSLGIFRYNTIHGLDLPGSPAGREREPVPRISPPRDFAKPEVSLSDSVSAETMRVKRYREINGLGEKELLSVMSMEQYLKRNLENNFYRTWQDNKKRFELWTESSKTRGGGLTDLDFVVPGSKALERFVGGQTRINIDGREKITFSGRSEWTEGQIETSVSKNSSFPSLTMKQEPSFRINGDVGRVHVDIKQDPQTGQFSNLEENISIKYQGEERDIIKYIEAGNTSLSLEGATFAGYRGSHKGLFGIRAEGQLGPLKFTSIASQEKSEANVKTFRGSAEQSTNRIRDYEYKANTYFFIDFLYRQRFANTRDSFDRILYNPADSLVVIEVYEDDNNIANNLHEGTFALRGEAYPMNMLEGKEYPEYKVDGYFHKLEPQKDYYVDRSLGYIRFKRRVPDESTIGVYIETRDGRVYGSLDYDTNDPNSKIKLKLIKRKKQLPTDVETWPLEWKNVYDLGQRNIDAEGLEIRIYREATDGVSKDTQDGVPLIHILGLDMKDELGNPTPDNKIDLNRGFINFYDGELIFPDLEPFNPKGTLPGVEVELKEKIPKIYNTQNRQEKEEASRYYIEVKTSSRQSVIQLGTGFMGIMEGTEQDILNGKPLTRGKDYRIDYMNGRITLLNEEATTPTADLQIRYEEPNAFQEMQKTLVGLRGELDLFTNSRIGAVTLFKNESTTERRVKLGQEPSRMILFDTDARFNFESRLVTNLLDRIPGLYATETSTFRLEAEFARSMPTLNTRGVVYIDDFEGSHNTPLSVVRSRWTTASPPDPSTTGGKMLKRGRLQWYNPWNRVKSKDIWPNKETTAGENTVHVLTLGYGKPEDVPREEAFAGIMTSLFGGGQDLSRARFIEIWARGAKGDLKIDIGSISEDFYPLDNPNGLLDTEDKPIPGQGHGDNILTKEEDTGLDGMFDEQEKEYYRKLGDLERAALDDPSGDNFYYKSGERNNYTRINGTEGNASDGDRLGMPDTEDINHNGILDTRNNYYEYTISFSDPDDPYLVEDSVPVGEPHGWRLFRIPLWNNPRAEVTRDSSGNIAPPDSTLIEFARMWITNTDSTLIQIASIQIVESTWLEQGIEGDEIGNARIRVTNVNTHENLEYSPPPGVKAEIDRETKIRKKEQSLVIKIEDLEPENTALIYRNFQRMNLTDYTSLKMYVHGPEDFPGPGDDESDVELVFRFGADKNNYYEYRTPVFRGWDKRNYIDIDFEKCTALKLLPWNRRYLMAPDSSETAADPWYEQYIADPDSADKTLDTWYAAFLEHPDLVAPVADTVGAKVYTIKGRPSLDNVKIISIGVKNRNEYRRLTCDIWVNELRMDTERNMVGNAARVNITTNLGGFMNINAAATRKEDDFHDMNSKSGSGQDNTDWNANISMNLDKFTPNRWNLQIPVSASVRESSALPRLMSGSDIILKEDQKKEFESSSSDRKYRISFRKNQDKTQQIIDITSWEDLKNNITSFDHIKGTFIHWAFDKVNASYDFGEQRTASPFSGTNLSNNSQLKVGYDVNPKGKTFKPFDWLPQLPVEMWEKFADLDFAFTPRQLNYEYVLNDRNQYRTNIDAVSDTTKNRTASEKLNFGYDPLKTLRYTFSREKTKDMYLKKEVKFSERNQISFTGPTLFYLKNSYSYGANYTETDNPRYSLSSQLGSKAISMTKSLSFNGSLEWNKFFEDISGKPKPPREKFRRKKKEKKEWDAEKGKQEKPRETPPKPEKKKAEPPKKPEEKKKGSGLRTKILMGVSKSVSPISVDYSLSEGIRYAGIKDRPDFMVRFGRGTVPEPDSMTVVSRSNSQTQSRTYSGRTKFNLPLDIGISLSTRYDLTRTFSPSANTSTENRAPLELKFNWSRLEDKIPYIKEYLSGLSVNSSYSVSRVRGWQNDKLTTDKAAVKMSPLFSISAKLLKKIQVSFTMSRSVQGTDDFSGNTFSFSEKVDNSTSTSLRYSLSSSKGFPLFRGLKLNSDINLGLTLSTQSSRMRRGVGDEPMALISSNDSWAISPSADYTFSRKFRGGMQMNFRNSVDMTKKVRKIREVSIWGEMMF